MESLNCTDRVCCELGKVLLKDGMARLSLLWSIKIQTEHSLHLILKSHVDVSVLRYDVGRFAVTRRRREALLAYIRLLDNKAIDSFVREQHPAQYGPGLGTGSAMAS
jgi:hypothetical protein